MIGATGTIGTAIVKKLREEHDVISVGSKSGDYQLDLTSPVEIEKMFKRIDNVDAVVSATGSASFEKLENMTPELNAVAVQSTLLGQINLVLIGQHYLNENGSFTLTTGVMMDDPILQGSSAAMANGGVAAFIKSAAIELKKGIRINSVSPTIVEESLAVYGDFFKGFNPVPVDSVANAYIKSVEGAQTGQNYRIY